ncbi:MAG TPA: sigma 54-interacting transcriptional regulator [Polyangiaceae bacterium LLY-WYZ-15_(1-7)]|nr:sigma 54-interacting transcriptional regulator [Polyangiaceae bacterium LLY-WYZ-15_(1-7)]HJL12802.1 sigma 54-interacting transcriptional regulator [Polyangiaceae bacterium LLY-WYZ-15_(1-7)]HJL25078.1 sigma 54-interacting transcriptional regulator [Polyangiaceae bacterium LLY-WYZ-15_(1-7)]HJL34899.1 sigma 54-interacting transcriptional regulator [Polyangiaceae bacterium LLY-WYZ-15_(1-7)]
MRDTLILSYRDEPLREFVLGERALEVGRGAFCDIVIHDPSVPERACRVVRLGGVPSVDFGDGRSPVGLPVGEKLRLGRHHALVRVATASPAPERGTEPLTLPSLAERVSIVVGRGAEARRVALDRPITVGSGPGCDLVLGDRAVSQRHCRLEPVPSGVRVRDCGSRNGTWVGGRRVSLGEIGPGAVVRVGRTDLHLVPRGAAGDARDGGRMVAASPAMLSLLGEVEQLAQLSWPVLVQGESGAGKEGVARALHERGPRARGPFVALNAGGLPRGTVESELFGHERGAFTGAAGEHRGVFEQADGGTLFLDEVGELPLDLQARLLRVLETWEVRRVGAERSRRVDVRLVCATHRDLRAMISDGRFRRDLFHRIHRVPLVVPPLRHRPEDIRPLAERFLADAAPEVGCRRELTPDAEALLVAHRWPGNVRELRSVVEVAALRSPTRRISREDVRRALERVAGVPEPDLSEDAQLRSVVRQYGGNLSAAARALGMARSTLRDRMRKGETKRRSDDEAA